MALRRRRATRRRRLGRSLKGKVGRRGYMSAISRLMNRGRRPRRQARRRLGVRTAGFRGAYPTLDSYAAPMMRAGGKRRVGSLVNTAPSKRMRRTIMGKGCPEISMSGMRMGRYKPMTVTRLMTTLVPKVITRWQGVQPFLAQTVATAGIVAGYYDMRFQKDSVTQGVTSSAFPCFVVSLDDYFQEVQNPGATPYECMWRLSITGTGAPRFTPVSNTLHDGTVSLMPDVQWAQGAEAQVYPRPNADVMHVQHKWHDFRFLFYGAKTQPTNYEIIIWRPTEEYMDIRSQLATYTFNGTLGTEFWEWPDEKEKDTYANFWASQVNQLVGNPILPRPTHKGGYPIKVLKRVTVEVPCRQEYQEVQAPNAKAFKLFMRDDRLLGLQWNAPAAAYDGGTSTNDNRIWSTTEYNQQLSEDAAIQNQPRIKARTYMTIRALNYLSRSTAEATIDTQPSFDMVWRRKTHLGVFGPQPSAP